MQRQEPAERLLPARRQQRSNRETEKSDENEDDAWPSEGTGHRGYVEEINDRQFDRAG